MSQAGWNVMRSFLVVLEPQHDLICTWLIYGV